MTENKFRYYKNKIWAYKQPDKPLLSVPLLEILTIDKQKLKKNEAQFEIILMQNVSNYLREKGVIERMFESPSKKKGDSPERGTMAGHLMRIPKKP